ncbi:palmitoyltransferase ZDHHC11-like [Emys orbicularis]|uniref:palmitoyltransferase ZDHHC11-like n=1 Tax=Emys orbicularis TaxID=82168 RepID=UPI0031FD88EA
MKAEKNCFPFIFSLLKKTCDMSSPTCCISNVCNPQRSRFSKGYQSILLYHYKPLGFVDHYCQCCCIFWYWMNCYGRRLRRTGPEQLNSRNDLVSPPQHSRVNGWSLPLHTFQIVALLFYTYLAIVGFGIYIPLLPHGWKYAAYAVIGVLFAHHLVAHLVAITIDPADQNVLAKKNYSSPMPVFDRGKHKHVIQNQHCYLCEVDVGPKAKHCSACNKCIADFDHHCKWLNNCVGGRNYWFFFNAVASAVLGVFLLILVILYVFIQYFVNPAELRTAPQFERVIGNNTWLAFLPVAPAETTAAGILAIAVITVLLGIASLLLLGHLLIFHLYLLGKKLSTFDYMTEQRRTQNTRDPESDVEVTENTSVRMDPLQDLSLASQQKECEVSVSSQSGALQYHETGQVSIKHPSIICTEASEIASFTNLSPGPETVPKSTKETLCESIHQNKEISDTEMADFGDLQSNCNQSLEESHWGSLGSMKQIPSLQNLHEESIRNSTLLVCSMNANSLAISDQVLSHPESGRPDASITESANHFKRTALAKEGIEMAQSGTATFSSPKQNDSSEPISTQSSLAV